MQTIQMMALRITTLVEDREGVRKELRHEHGLSFYIEYQGRTLLFDTGQSGLFLDNADALRINVRKLDHVLLSHGHYDHAGGFRSLCTLTNSFHLWTGAGFFHAKYDVRQQVPRFLGCDFGPEYIRQHDISHTVIDRAVTEIVPGIHAVSRFPRIHAEEKIPERFALELDGRMKADTFSDEILLVIETGSGLVVLLGCSHPGMCNMLDAVKQYFSLPLFAVLGGAHLVEADDEHLDAVREYLCDASISSLGLCHCTGEKAELLFSKTCKGFFSNKTGTVFTVDR